MFKRKLLKRALPVILSVAMVFESMPATALAAENGEGTAIEETVSETDETVDENTESSDDAPGSSGAEQPEDSKTSEISTAQETETAGAENDNKAETEQAQTETTAEVETVAATIAETEQTETEQIAEVNAEGESAEKPAAEIDLAELPYWLGEFSRKPGVDSDSQIYTRTYEYNPDEGLFDGVITRVGDSIKIKVDNENKENVLKSKITYKYQKETDGNWADVDGIPTDAGSYRLVVSVAETDICKAAEDAYIYLEVEPLKLTLNVNPSADPDDVVNGVELTAKPGDNVADFIKKLETKYTLSGGETSDGKGYESVTSLSVKIYERDSEGNLAAEPTTDTVLDSSKDYAVTLAVVFDDYCRKL